MRNMNTAKPAAERVGEHHDKVFLSHSLLRPSLVRFGGLSARPSGATWTHYQKRAKAPLYQPPTRLSRRPFYVCRCFALLFCAALFCAVLRLSYCRPGALSCLVWDLSNSRKPEQSQPGSRRRLWFLGDAEEVGNHLPRLLRQSQPLI